MQQFILAEFKESLERRLKQVQADIALEFNSDKTPLIRKGEMMGVERCLQNTLYALAGYTQTPPSKRR